MAKLEDLLRECTVKIIFRRSSSQGYSQGTGFFVADNLILTCAHVIKDRQKKDIDLKDIKLIWRGKEDIAYVESIELIIPDYSYDVALLKVKFTEEFWPICADLDGREDSFRSMDNLHMFGYPTADCSLGRPIDAICQGSNGDGEIDFKFGQVDPGMSGAPLLNQRTGRVCGIVKYTQGSRTLLGGGAIPVSRISAKIPDLIRLNLVSKSNMRQRVHKADSVPLALIEEKTEDFIGRSYVFSAIESFMSAEPNGYFILTGYPGQGKSSILAKYVQDHECAYFFNDMLTGINKTQDFLKSVHSQLISKFDTGYDSVPNDAESSGAFLADVLSRISSNTQERIVIVIDALDEVNISGHPDDSNILYLPSRLPGRVYFIVSVRSEFDVSLHLRKTSRKTFDLNDDKFTYETMEDIRAYILSQIDKSPTLREKIQELNESKLGFIERVAQKSDKNFMYLHYVMSDFKEGKFGDLKSLDHLPIGLQDYYRWHWDRMGMSPKNGTLPPKDKIRILFILAELKEAVSRTLLIHGYLNNGSRTISQITKSVDSVLKHWGQFLKIKNIPPEILYYIYHSSFRDFLMSKSEEYMKFKERYPEIFRELRELDTQYIRDSIADVNFEIFSSFESGEDMFR